MATIYVLRCPDTRDIRYIGKADNIEQRLHHHVCCERNPSHKTRWILKLLREGKQPAIETLFLVPVGMKWQHVERFFIASARSFCLRITNSTLGGEGLSFVHDADRLRWRGKLTEARTASWRDEEYRASTIKKSKAGLANPAVREKMSAIRKALRGTSDARSAQGEITRQSWSDPAARAKRSAGIKSAWADPDVRARQIAAQRASHASPEAKARKSVAMKAAWARRKREAAQQSEGVS